MPLPEPTPRPLGGGDLSEGPDPELEEALKRVLEVVQKEHPLSPNQILALSAELQRVGVHRLVEEHLRRFRQRLRAEAAEES